MNDDLEFAITISLFVIIAAVTYKSVRTGLKYDEFLAWAVTLGVSTLSIIGMKQVFGGSLQVILLPYATFGISIFAVLILLFIAGQLKNTKQRSDKDAENRQEETKDRLKR